MRTLVAFSVFILLLRPLCGALLTNCTNLELNTTATYTINSNLDCRSSQIHVEISSNATVTLAITTPTTLAGVRFVVYEGSSLSFAGSNLSLVNSSAGEGNVPSTGAGYGGVLCNFGVVVFSCEALSLINNTAGGSDTRGGSVYVGPDALLTVYSTVNISSNFVGADDGGGLYADGNVTFAGQSNWVNLQAISQGGALFVSKTGFVTFQGESVFCENNAVGAAIFSNGVIVFEENATSTFYLNVSPGSGGALLIYSGSATFLAPASFINNTAIIQGTAVYVQFGASVVFMYPTLFSGNNITEAGIYIIGGDGDIQFCGLTGDDAMLISKAEDVPLTCDANTSSTSKRKKIIIWVSVAVGVLLIGLSAAWYFRKKNIRIPWKRVHLPNSRVTESDESSMSNASAPPVLPVTALAVCTAASGESKSPSNDSEYARATAPVADPFSYYGNRETVERISAGNSPTNDVTETPMRVIQYAVLQEATGNFNHKLGEGGFGEVFKGSMTVESGRTIQIAVKHLDLNSQQGFKELWTEVTMLWRLRQSNLVPVLAVCPDPCCIVYPLMENGSLLSHLEDPAKRSVLQWRDRVSIMLDVATGLAFLHDQKVVHRDIKPANILLSGSMVARLSDFGIARVLASATFARTDPIGSYLYMDPHYLASGILSRRSDMYSYGIVGLQLLSGREERAIPGLRITVQSAVANSELKNTVDSLCTEWPENILPGFTDLMLACTEGDPQARITALQSVQLLQNWIDKAPSAPKPADEIWECLVCLEEQRTELFKPCLHCVCCAACAALVVASVLPQCPLCRCCISAVVPNTEGGRTYSLRSVV